ncbi:MAG: hypothetical protein HY748_00110 [Elusimicrobia bacterium]|nr:hypothetical protein [Elusimicrobiota bacterium]
MDIIPSGSDPQGGGVDRTTVVLIALGVVVTAGLLLAAFFMMRGGGETGVASSGKAFFPKPGAAPDSSQALSRGPAPGPGQAGGDSTSFVSRPAGVTLPSASEAAATAAGQPDRAREKGFMARHGAEFRGVEARMAEIGARYHRTRPIVREVDAAFGRLPDYMALKRRYEKDRDPYQFARDAISLPEVRRTIRKYMARPEAWGVAADMALEGLRDPPPKPIYDEVKRFLREDSTMKKAGDSIAEEAAANVTVGMPALVGKDIRPVQNLLAELDR